MAEWKTSSSLLRHLDSLFGERTISFAVDSHLHHIDEVLAALVIDAKDFQCVEELFLRQLIDLCTECLLK